MNRDKYLEGKVAIVTGSSRGIGAETAKMFAIHGASVIVNYLNNKDAALKVVDEIKLFRGQAVAVQADVTKNTEVDQLVATAMNTFGKVDILVLNASIGFPIQPFTTYQWKDFELKLTNELKATFISCQAVVPLMIEQGGGSIVMVSSGLSKSPSMGMIAHSTAKSGIDAFAKSLALELGPKGIRVNVTAPGLTETDATKYTPTEVKEGVKQFTPLQRLAQPKDIAEAVLFLASDLSQFITGAYLPVSGGIQMI